MGTAAVVVSVWLLVWQSPRDENSTPTIYLDGLASKEECERVKMELLPSVQQRAFKCFEVKRAR